MVGTSAYSFGKKHKLCSKALTEELFSKGKSLFAYPFRCVYLISEPPSGDHAPVQILISVSKKKHKRAVTRNLIKRRTREAYRQNMHLWGGHDSDGRILLLALVYTSDEILKYPEIENGIRKAIQSVKKRTGEDRGLSAGGVD